MTNNKETKLTCKVYSKNINEWNRLTKDPFHALEFETTLKFLKKYLPKTGTILDAGGGPGRYSITLAKMGYEMTLLDLVKQHLQLAKKQIQKAGVQSKIKNIVEGSITDLSYFKSNHFDAVLCLGGPLSHVSPTKERIKAISELVRVAKPRAPIFVSVVGKFGTIARFFPRLIDEVKDEKHFKRVCLTGDDYRWHDNAYAHFFELNELKSLFKGKINFLAEVGLQGLASPSQEQINKMARREPKAWKNWLEMHDKLCTNSSVAECSLHFMVIGKKK